MSDLPFYYTPNTRRAQAERARIDSQTKAEAKLIVNDRIFQGWEEVEVTRSIEAVAGAFRLVISDKWAPNMEAWAINPGDKCTLQLADETVISGYIDELEIVLGADERTMTVTGRDRTSDIVDCSAQNRPGEWTNSKLEKIAADLCSPVGVGVWVDNVSTGDALKKFALQPGETILEAIARAAKSKKVLLTSSAAGMLLITKAGSERPGFTLKEGENILEVKAKYSLKERYSKYLVEGQREGYDSPPSTSDTHYDPSVKRFRPLTILADEQADKRYCKARAAWEATTRAGKASPIVITVQGWTMPNGRLWRPNFLYNVNAPSVRVNNVELLVAEISYTLNDSGTKTVLTMRRRDAYTDEVDLPVRNEPAQDVYQ